MKLLISIIVIWCCVKCVFTSQCYWNNACKYKYFSSKTPYEIIRGDIRDSIAKRRDFGNKQCEPISIWVTVRHGKRNPSTKFAEDIKAFLTYRDDIIASYKMGNSTLCAQDIENIKNWEVDTDMFVRHNEIDAEGYQELVNIAQRFKEAFPELLNEIQNKDYEILTAYGSRMTDSAKAFNEGLTPYNLTISEAENNYSVLAPYASCGRYQIDVRRNPNIYAEEVVYTGTAEYQNMKERLLRKLGLDVDLTSNNITAIYDLCRYSWEGINNKPSPWCALFTEEDLQVLEYIGDIRHYYRNGYGASKYTKILGQIPLSDMLTKFEEAKRGRGKTLVTYVTHATMLDMILVALNLHNDTNPLMGTHRNIYRKWRSTFLSPFANNLIGVLYRCSSYGSIDYDYNVALYWNELPLLELCKEGVCSWWEFQKLFKPFLNTNVDVCEFKWTTVD
ncbi:hypothetical protein B5X24_HaOG204013 [Helicoverpa armigera]|uniref:Multiple inositol polyphosphate phosphatase 1 n=1 Tax=Helicoverpa armigera TaxID=29058 RepID=A0A2W1BW81_HELAM|nr:hypothetical protein B5X24_HaOG204013 [Helicoverpa armigera]